MNTDTIIEIIDKMNELPYKCIMFNGVWGIGKSYAAEKAKEKHTKIIIVSLSGISLKEDIYREILNGYILRKENTVEIAKILIDKVLGVLKK